MAESVVVAVFDFPYEAQSARDSLEFSGIPSVIANQDVGSMQLGNSAGGIRLLVLSELTKTSWRFVCTERQRCYHVGVFVCLCLRCFSIALAAGTGNYERE